MTCLSAMDDAVICLLDIAKAFPSTPPDAIHTALELIGAPHSIRMLVSAIYSGSTNRYQDFQYKLPKGIKEGCPLSPSLFLLVFERFHATRAAEFRVIQFFVYVDDIVVLAPNACKLRRLFHCIDELSSVVGFRVNRGKTEVYH